MTPRSAVLSILALAASCIRSPQVGLVTPVRHVIPHYDCSAQEHHEIFGYDVSIPWPDAVEVDALRAATAGEDRWTRALKKTQPELEAEWLQWLKKQVRHD